VTRASFNGTASTGTGPGRPHRKYANMIDVRINGVVDATHPTLLRMWEKRQRGYRAMSFRIAEPSTLERATGPAHGVAS
jgi:hypothetical protein